MTPKRRSWLIPGNVVKFGNLKAEGGMLNDEGEHNAAVGPPTRCCGWAELAAVKIIKIIKVFPPRFENVDLCGSAVSAAKPDRMKCYRFRWLNGGWQASLQSEPKAEGRMLNAEGNAESRMMNIEKRHVVGLRAHLERRRL